MENGVGRCLTQGHTGIRSQAELLPSLILTTVLHVLLP